MSNEGQNPYSLDEANEVLASAERRFAAVRKRYEEAQSALDQRQCSLEQFLAALREFGYAKADLVVAQYRTRWLSPSADGVPEHPLDQWSDTFNE